MFLSSTRVLWFAVAFFAAVHVLGVDCAANAQCFDGCIINVSLIDDGACDCSQCEDEFNWTCASCPNCPSNCGAYVQCSGIVQTTESPTTDRPTTTSKPTTTASEQLPTDLSTFTCDDGCVITGSYYNDGYCDCTQCEDELFYTCATCPNCPVSCGAYVECTGEPQTTTDTSLFMCDDGCNIEANYYDDDWCDCSQCEDEPNWSCSTCGDCPDACGDFIECKTDSPTTTYNPTTTTTDSTFACGDGCFIPDSYYDDDWCDCPQCEDEPNWSCESCACPLHCGAVYVQCTGAVQSSENPTTTTYISTATANSSFVCDDGCLVVGSYYDDGYCDCSQCEDEANYTCATCEGGCPTLCGLFTFCAAKAQCFDGCIINGSLIDDGACDCSQCEDELNSGWNCTNCDGCPQTCGGRVLCVGGQTTDEPRTTEKSDDNDSGSTLSGGAIAGIVISLLALICCLLAFAVYRFIKSKSQTERKPGDSAAIGGVEIIAAAKSSETTQFATYPSLGGDHIVADSQQPAGTRRAQVVAVPRIGVESAAARRGDYHSVAVLPTVAFRQDVATVSSVISVGSTALSLDRRVSAPVSTDGFALPMSTVGTTTLGCDSMTATAPLREEVTAIGPMISEGMAEGFGEASAESQPGADSTAFALPTDDAIGQEPCGELSMDLAPATAFEVPTTDWVALGLNTDVLCARNAE